MALNLADRVTIMSAATMQARVKAAVVQYALYLLGGTPTAPQATWAKATMDDPDAMGRRVAPHLLDNPDYLTAGTGVTDQQLQGAVEAAVNTRFVTA